VLGAAIELAGAYQRDNQPGPAAEVYALVDRAAAAGGDSTDALMGAIARATFDGNQALVAGETARAIEQTRIAVALHERLAPNGREHATVVFGLATTYELSGEWAAAGETYADAARRFRASPGTASRDADLGDALEGVARNELERGHADAAVAPAREALDIAHATGDADHVQSASLALGRALLETGHPTDVVPLLEPLVRALDAAEHAPAGRRGTSSFVLAQALWATGGEPERARARSLTTDAINALSAARDEYAANPAYTVALRIVDARLAAARAWQSRHP
jgi:hypothetical protein